MDAKRAADWLALAQDARAIAERLTDVSARQTMLGIAEGYEKMARHAALRPNPLAVRNQADD